MQKEIRTVVRDSDLEIEAYRFRGAMRFPNHFHEYYVIGLLESGDVTMSCNGVEYAFRRGDMLLLNPGDSHTCNQSYGEAMDYRCLNIQPDRMQKAAAEIFGGETSLRFPSPIAYRSDLAPSLKELHGIIYRGGERFRKEELFLLFLAQLVEEHAKGSPAEPEPLHQLLQEVHRPDAEAVRENFCRKGTSGYAMNEIEKNSKCVIVVDENLPLGIIANTAAVLGITLGQRRPEIVGEDVTDASQQEHAGVVTIPVPILKGDGEKLRALRHQLYENEFDDLLVVDFSNVAQSCKTYDEYRGKVAAAPEGGHDYFGIALLGDRKIVNRLTGSMPLLR